MGVPAIAGDVLVVEDDERLGRLLSKYLSQHGFRVEVVGDAKSAYASIEASEPDVIVLDWVLPGGEDGLAVCRRLRETFAGAIIMHTARWSDVDEVEGLDGGADDYVIKPVEPAVLLARIRVHLRKKQPRPSRARFGSLLLDLRARSASVEGSIVHFTDMEAGMLCLLAEHAPEVVSRQLLTRAVRGVLYDGLDRGVDIHISRTRKKLRASDSKAWIHSVRGRGYYLSEEER